MNKKLVSFLLTLTLAPALLPTAALAAGTEDAADYGSMELSFTTVPDDDFDDVFCRVVGGYTGVPDELIGRVRQDEDYELLFDTDYEYDDPQRQGFVWDMTRGTAYFRENYKVKSSELVVPMIGVASDGWKKYRVTSFDVGKLPEAERAKVKSLVLPPSITDITPLWQLANLETVSFYSAESYDLRTVGGAFRDCARLKSVELPEGVETIEADAFCNCPKLMTVTVPASVTGIEAHAFGFMSKDGYNYEKVPRFILRGYTGSEAERYAEAYGVYFLAIDGDETDIWWGTGKTALDNFSAMPKAEYTPGQFSDVDENAWYGANKSGAVRTAYEIRIVNGRGGGIFDPEGSVSLAEAIKMAAVVHQVYSGGNNIILRESSGKWTSRSIWYEPYVDYCIAQGIIERTDFRQSYTRPATRAEMAYIFANALPYSELPAINDVTELPDVDEETPYFEDIFALYRCGALQGNDEYGAFTPDANITRAAAAAIISRVAVPSQRLTFTLKKDTPPVTVGSYTPGMWVYSLDELGKVYRDRALGLYPDMSVHMSEGLAQELRSTPGFYYKWARINASTVYNENDDDLMVIKLGPYDLVNELDALLADRTASVRASAKANGYLAEMEGILASLGVSNMGERDALAAIHNWMVANIAYDTSLSDDAHYFYGPLDSGLAVCDGYSELFYYLASLAGIECYTVGGDASSGAGYEDWAPHSWNVVYLTGDETPYFIDVTYDDPVPDTKTGRRSYFMVTAEQLAADHRW